MTAAVALAVTAALALTFAHPIRHRSLGRRQTVAVM